MALMRLLLPLFACALTGFAASRHTASGMVIALDERRHTLTISHDAIRDYMPAMTMEFEVRGKVPAELAPGVGVGFTLVVDRRKSWIEDVTSLAFESAERDPSLAGRLALIDRVTGGGTKALAVGNSVPEFTLTDQTGAAVSLSSLRGKVVGINFVYTRCPLPDYCFRLANNFARLRQNVGSADLVLLTITFDPGHDTPEKLAAYAAVWKADPTAWHFLTGTPEAVQKVCDLFGVTAWRDDGLLTHSLRTVLLDRTGHLAATLDGNKFSVAQLAELTRQVLAR